MHRLLTCICLTLLFNSCSKNSGPVNPIMFGDLTDAIFLSSFESNGDSTLSGWDVSNGLPANLLSFSRDIPIGGGYWSLRIRGTFGSIQSRIALAESDSLASYILTFWAKGNGYASLIINGSNGGWLKGTPVNVSSWTFFADTLSQHQFKYTTLLISLGVPTADSASSAFFDNIKVVKKNL